MLAPRALVRLLGGQGVQDPSPYLDLKVPGMQAGGAAEKTKTSIRTKTKQKHSVLVIYLKEKQLSHLSQKQTRLL